MTFDATEVHALASQMQAAPAKVMLALVPVGHKAGNKIKAGLRRVASGHRRLPGLVKGITYEITVDATQMRVETGWLNPTGQEYLDHIAAFGSVNNAPVMDVTDPLRAEVKPFVRWVSKIGGEAML